MHANLRPGDRAIMATAILAGLALIAAIFAGPYAALPELVGVGSALVSLFLLTAKMRGSRPNQRSDGRRVGSANVGYGPSGPLGIEDHRQRAFAVGPW